VDEQGSRINISTEKGQESGSIEVDVTDLDRDSLMYLIRCLYIRGYNEIKVNFNKQVTDHYRFGKKVKIVSMIHEEVNRLNGIEVVQQRENFCLIKDISQSSIKEFDVVLRRIFLLLTDAVSDLLRGGKKEDSYLLDSLQEKHNTITKFIAHNLRLLNKIGYPEHKNTSLLYYIIRSLDNITDTLNDSARDIVDAKIKFSKETESVLNTAHSSMNEYHNFFYKFDINFLQEITSTRYQLLKDIKKYSKKVNSGELRVIMGMWQIIEQILDLTLTRITMEY